MPSHPYLVGLIGAGIGPSLTPGMHMAEAKALGLDYIYRTIDIAALGIDPHEVGRLVASARTLGYDALNITHPCKQLVVPHLDDLDEQAARLGAVNTVIFTDRGAIGYNTDASGCRRPRDRAAGRGHHRGRPARSGRRRHRGRRCPPRAGHRAPHSRGCRRGPSQRPGQGAGRAVPDGPRRRRRLRQAARFGAGRRRSRALHPDRHGRPSRSTTRPQLLHPELWVADIVYRPLDTALLQAARAAGCRTLDGGHMAVHQAAHTFALVTGQAPDIERMFASFTRLLAD